MDESPYSLHALQALSELIHPFVGPPDFGTDLPPLEQDADQTDHGTDVFHYIDIDAPLPCELDLKPGDSVVLVKVVDSHFRAIHGEHAASHALKAMPTPPEFEQRDLSQTYLFPLPGQPNNTYCLRRLEAVTLGRGELELILSAGKAGDAPALPCCKVNFTIV